MANPGRFGARIDLWGGRSRHGVARVYPELDRSVRQCFHQFAQIDRDSVGADFVGNRSHLPFGFEKAFPDGREDHRVVYRHDGGFGLDWFGRGESSPAGAPVAGRYERAASSDL